MKYLLIFVLAFAACAVGAQSQEGLRLAAAGDLSRARPASAPARAGAAADAPRAPRLRLDYGTHSFPHLQRLLVQAKPVAAAGGARAPAYADQLIDGTIAPEEARDATRAAETLPGRRFLGADFGVLQRDHSAFGRSTELGTRLRYRRETETAGEFLLEADLRRLSPGAGDTALAGDARSGGRFTLYQTGYALTESLRMDNAIGVVNSSTHPLLSNSLRVFLPGSLVNGALSAIADEKGELRLQAGSIGRNTGSIAQQFDADAGSLAGVGYVRRLDERWSAGAQLWRLSGHPTVAAHDSTALALQYETPARDLRLKGNALRDSFGKLGLWVDGESRAGRVQHRFGAFRMEPRLLWTDTAVLNDQQGAHYRYDYLSTALTLSGGAEITRNNLDNDPLRAATRSALAFGSGNWRIDQYRSAGGTLTLRDDRTVGGLAGAPPALISTASLFGTQRFEFGTSRVQLNFAQTRSTLVPSRSHGVAWNHDVSGANGIQVGTLLGLEYETGNALSADRLRAGLTGRVPVAGSGSLSGSLSYTQILRGSSAGEKNLNTNLLAEWTFAPEWSMQLQLGSNRAEAATLAPQAPLRETILLVQLRYAESSGVPFAAEGLRGTGSGAGTVRGRVFFDENNDGIWQATEKAAADVPVYLDGRYFRRSDRDGRFEFPLVPTGEHTLRVAVENVPLPWGLLDLAPRRLRVPLRGEVVLDIPLQRLDR